MLVLEGRGAPDAEAFHAAGISDFDLYEFEREGRRPDGSATKVAFALAFAKDPLARDAAFFTCQHRYPENFWNPAFQSHPNTATAVAGVVLVAENPSDHHIFLEAFAGQRDLLATSAGLSIKTPRGEIQVMQPDAFRDRFGVEPPDTARGARLAALRFAVRDLDVVTERLQAESIASSSRMGRIMVDPDIGLGATLTFERI
jgi:hypothetical protein